MTSARHLIKCTWMLIGLIHSPSRGAKNTDNAGHNAVGAVISWVTNIDISSSRLEQNFADSLARECYSLLAAWVVHHPDQAMVTPV